MPVAARSRRRTRPECAALIDPDHATARPMPDEPGEADTIYLTVVDKDFNAVSLLQSVFSGFGSHHVPDDLGFSLQNRGCLFALDPSHANSSPDL